MRKITTVAQATLAIHTAQEKALTRVHRLLADSRKPSHADPTEQAQAAFEAWELMKEFELAPVRQSDIAGYAEREALADLTIRAALELSPEQEKEWRSLDAVGAINRAIRLRARAAGIRVTGKRVTKQ